MSREERADLRRMLKAWQEAFAPKPIDRARIEIRFDRHHSAHRAVLREQAPELAALFDRPGRTLHQNRKPVQPRVAALAARKGQVQYRTIDTISGEGCFLVFKLALPLQGQQALDCLGRDAAPQHKVGKAGRLENKVTREAGHGARQLDKRGVAKLVDHAKDRGAHRKMIRARKAGER